MKKRDNSICFKDEFATKNIGFSFNIIGESKQSFVQSHIRCLGPRLLMLYRLFVSAYLIFGMIFSIVNEDSTHPWIVFMTSCTYILTLVYFVYGFSLSWFSVFCNIDYCRSNTFSRGTENNGLSPDRPIESRKQKNDVKMTELSVNNDKNATVSSTTSSISGSTSQLMLSNTNSRYSVDSIIFDIEENSKRFSYPRDPDSASKRDLHHARLNDNRLPSMNSDVFLSDKIGDATAAFKVYWLLSSCAINLSLLTVIVYWSFLYVSSPSSALQWYLRIDRHGVACLLVLLDHVMSRMPIRFLHFIYPSIMMLVYGIYNAIYCLASKKYIYSKMNFVEETGFAVAMVTLCVFIASPCAHFVVYWCVYRAREKLLT